MKIDPKSEEIKLAERLDYYFHDRCSYMDYLQSIKECGYRVYRNSIGKHKVKRNENYLNEVFGGIFKEK